VRRKRRKEAQHPAIPDALPSHLQRALSVDFVRISSPTVAGSACSTSSTTTHARCVLRSSTSRHLQGSALRYEAGAFSRADPTGYRRRTSCDQRNPSSLRSDVLVAAAARRKAALHSATRQADADNASSESFQRQVREYCLDLSWFTSSEDRANASTLRTALQPHQPS
jgi:hypothetical protein